MISRKLVHKITVLSIVPVIISMILFGGISYTIYKDQLIHQRMDEARSLILLSSEEMENPLYFIQLDKLNTIIGNIKDNPNVISVFVLDADGKVITDGTSENKFNGQILTDDFSERSIKSSKSIVVIEKEVLKISSPVIINEKIGTVMIDFSLKELDNVLTSLIILLGAIGAIIVIVISLINFSISNNISKPVTELKDAANEIAKGNFSARTGKRSDDEIGELEATFNKMAEDLKRSSENRIVAEDALKKSDERFQSFMRNFPGLAYMKDNDGRVVFANEGFNQYLGMNPASMTGKSNYDLFPAEFAEKITRDDKRILESGRDDTVEEVFAGRNWVTYKFPIPQHGALPVLGGLTIDITERKQAEEMLKKLSSAVEQSGDCVIITDRNANIEYVNPAFERLTGFSGKEAIGKKPTFLKSEKHNKKFYSELHDTIISGSVFNAEIINKKKNGELYIAETTIMPIKDILGNITHFVSTEKDITERKKSEKMFIENQHLALASKTKSEFLANMSHELRTPLNSIIGFSELMLMNSSLENKQKHFLENILTSGKFLLNLINDILDISKIEAGKIELSFDKVDVTSVIDETLTLIKENALKHNVILVKKFDPDLSYFEADQQRLKQILFNLLSNAVKFSKPEGGTVTITVKKEGDMAKFSVSDTGIGIKDENMDKLFSAFEQLDSGITKQYGGTGLGLAITKKLVELHGGKIIVESRYGEGSTFTFAIPMLAKKME